MGNLNPFAMPKMPAPQVIENPVTNNDLNDQTAIEAERRRRALATGSSGNIVSSLSSATADAASTSRKTLLGG